MRSLRSWFLCLILGLSFATIAAAREWHRADGTKYCDGKLIKVENGVATILSDAGQSITISVRELSLEDLTFVQEAMALRDQLAGPPDGKRLAAPARGVPTTRGRQSAGAMPRRSGIAVLADDDKFPLTDPKSTRWQYRADPAAWTAKDSLNSQMVARLPAFQNNDRLVFPQASSPFVAIAVGVEPDIVWEMHDLRSGRRTGVIRTMTSRRHPPVINAEGTLAAGFDDENSNFVNIWSFETGQRVFRIPVEERYDSYVIGFVATGGILVKQGAEKLAVYGSPDGDLRVDIPLTRRSDVMTAISPGGHYFAALPRGTSRIVLYDSRNGAVAGEVDLPEQHPWQCHALAFSDDGQRLLSQVSIANESRLLTWDLSNGELKSVATEDSASSAFRRRGSFNLRSASPIMELPGHQGVLLAGLVAVEASTGKSIWDYNPGDEQNKNPIQRLIGESQMLVVRSKSGTHSLAVESLPKQEIIASKTIVQQGGTVSDVGLPASTAAKWQRNSLPQSIAAAKDSYAPSKPVAPAQRFPAQLKLALPASANGIPAQLEYFIAGDDRTNIAVVSRNFQGSPEGNLATVGLFNLRNGRRAASFNLPRALGVLDVSPDGSKVVANTTSDGRIDIWDIAAGKHVIGFRPLRPDRITQVSTLIQSASFVSDERLWTNDRDEFALWNLETAAPIVNLAKLPGAPISLDSARQYLLTQDKQGLRICQAQTGQAVVTLEAAKFPSDCVLYKGVFRDDGSKVAMLFSGQTAQHLLVWNIAGGNKIECNMDLSFRAMDVAWSGDDVLLGNIVENPNRGSQVRLMNDGPLEFGYERRAASSGEAWQKEFDGAVLRVSPTLECIVWIYLGRFWKVAGQVPQNAAWLARSERQGGASLVLLSGRTAAEEKAIAASAGRNFASIGGAQIAVDVTVGPLPEGIDRANTRRDEMQSSLMKVMRERMSARTVRATTARPAQLRVSLAERGFDELTGFENEAQPGRPRQWLPPPDGAATRGVLARIELVSADNEPVWFAEAWFAHNRAASNARGRGSQDVQVQMMLLATWERAVQWLNKQELPTTIVNPNRPTGAGTTNLDVAAE